VAPGSGDLLLADPGNNRVNRYEADGTFVSSFDGADAPDGAFTGLLDLDLAPNGDAYVVDSQGPVFVEGEEPGSGGPETCVQNNYCSAAASRVLRFDAAGAYQGTVQPLTSNAAGLVSFDPNNSQLLVGLVNPQGSLKVDVYDAGGDKVDTLRFPNFFTWFPSMAIDAGSSDRLYAVTDRELQQNFESFVGEVAVQVFSPVTLPDVAIDPLTPTTATTAQLSGSVDPEGTQTAWRFEYRLQGAAPWLTGPSGDAGAGTTPVVVSGELTALQPNREYEARLVATGAAAKDVATAAASFKTGTAAPIVFTRFAAPRATTTARLNGYVNPRNEPTTFYFEWGPNDSYGNSAPASEDGSAGSLGDQTLVSEELSGLQPGTTYHYRLIAENSAGPIAGEDQTFTTRTVAEMAEPRRGIELVNPPDKSNQNPYGYLTPTGDGVIWSVYTGGPQAPIGEGASFKTVRTSSGWQSSNMVPPADQQLGDGELPYSLAGATDDYSEQLFQVGKSPNDGGEEPPASMVRIDRDGNQTVLHTFPTAKDFWFGSTTVAGGVDHVFMLTSERLDPSHPEGVREIYDIGVDPPVLVSRLPGTGVAPLCGLEANEFRTDFGGDHRWTSADGSVVYFSTRGDDCAAPIKLYRFDSQGTASAADDTTTALAPTPVAGPDEDQIALQVSPAGGIVFYSPSRLTADDDNLGKDIYRSQPGGALECLTCVVEGAEVTAGISHDSQVVVSKDLSHVYFTSNRQLFPGLGVSGTESLYVWHHGAVDYISPLEGFFTRPREVSPDGETLIFNSKIEGVTADANGGLAQYYRYSDVDGSVECLTCSPPGVPPQETGEHAAPMLAFTAAPGQAETPQLTEDGETFVFQSTAALVPRDVNNDIDIYEWRNGRTTLLTDGVSESGGGAAPMQLQGISPDGVNVLFKVGLKLTGYEHDNLAQLYVARAGGGFPPPPVPPAPCAEDACQGPLSAPPPFADPGSAGLRAAGPGKKQKQHRPKRHQKKRHHKHKKSQKKKQGDKQRGAGRHANHRNG
jgi:hypothetical protein